MSMLKNMTNFIKGADLNNPAESEEMEIKREPKREVRREETEEEMLQNFSKKIAQTSDNFKNTIRSGDSTIYENDVFTNRSNQVKIVKPKSYENAEVIGEAIKDGKVIILDLNKLETQLATRILDFVTGICFAYNIEPEKVEAKIFMIDPDHKRKR